MKIYTRSKHFFFLTDIVFILLMLLVFVLTSCKNNIPNDYTSTSKALTEVATSKVTVGVSTTKISAEVSTSKTESTQIKDTEPSVPQKFAIIVSGASRGDQDYKWFLDSTGMAYDLLKNNGYPEENIYYLFESEKEPDVDYQATIANFKKVTEDLQKRTNNMDSIVAFLIGHGNYNGINSTYALSYGSLHQVDNLTDSSMADMFKKIKRDKLIFVFSPCNSGGFIDDLSGENTVIITSTQKDESNSAAFIEPFLAAFNGIGDTNSDGKVSFAEAFNYASNNVKEQYKINNWGELTEHAQLDDNGDKISHEAPVPDGGDGNLAEKIFLK